MAIVAVLVSGIVAMLLGWSTRQANVVAAQRQEHLLTLLIDQAKRGIPHDQEGSTVWDDAVNVLRGPYDPDWLDANLGIWMHDYFGHDATFVLDPQDRPIYAMRDGRRVSPSSYDALVAHAGPLVSRLRAAIRADAPIDPATGVLSPGVVDLVRFDGHPAILSIKPVRSYTGKIAQVAGDEFLHLSLRFLDGSFLDGLAEQYLFERPRFAWTQDPVPGELAWPLHAGDGQPLGFLLWTADRPGALILSALEPALMAALIGVVGMLVLLVVRLWRRSVQLEASQTRAQHLALHDPLTGLPNRALFQRQLDQALQRVRDGGQQVGLLYLDLDRFKQVNDVLGHLAGDELLREFGRRLAGVIRGKDTLARFGGDEFAVILADLGSLAAAESICRRIIEVADAPFVLAGSEAFVSVSIGLALAPAHGSTDIELMRNADLALYHAKRNGRRRFTLFDDGLSAAVQRRQAIEQELRQALDAIGQLHLHFQPVHAAASGRLTGLEALLRWEHPTQGPLAPGGFIQVAEESGLIDPLGAWVLREACSAAVAWPVEFIAVNVSAVQLRSPSFVTQVTEILAVTGLAADRLELEITETIFVERGDRSRANIRALRALGIRIALDDFGMGYSSLGQLHQLEVDHIKIDRSFVHALGQAGRDGRALVQAMVDLARAMGLKTTAEGVETEEQAALLRQIGCDELQGWLLSPPLPASAIDRLFATRSMA